MNQMIYFLSIGMVFNVNAGFSGLVNESADNSEGKNYALFIGDTVVVNEVRFVRHTVYCQLPL